MIGTTDVRAVRLVVDDATLEQRVRDREQDGVGAGDQLRRSLAYAATIRAQRTAQDVFVLDTSAATIGAVAAEIVGYSGWA